MFENQRFGDFLNSLASSDPTPGGGSGSIAAGMIGLALIEMALVISDSRREPKDFEAVRSALGASKLVLAGLEFQDRQAFGGYLAAVSLPKGDDAEFSHRRHLIKEALLSSCKVPLDAGREMCFALGRIASMNAKVNNFIVSDLLAGAIILESAAVSILLNVHANASLPILEQHSASLVEEANTIEREAAKSLMRLKEVYAFI
jgi:formiminotetrahydrofolate cyclodeaminase